KEWRLPWSLCGNVMKLLENVKMLPRFRKKMMQRWISCSMDFKEEIKMLNEFETTMTEALKPYVNRILASYADAIRANDGVINDHNGNLEKVSGLVITARMETCPVIQGTAVCTNPVFIK